MKLHVLAVARVVLAVTSVIALCDVCEIDAGGIVCKLCPKRNSPSPPPPLSRPVPVTRRRHLVKHPSASSHDPLLGQAHHSSADTQPSADRSKISTSSNNRGDSGEVGRDNGLIGRSRQGHNMGARTSRNNIDGNDNDETDFVMPRQYRKQQEYEKKKIALREQEAREAEVRREEEARQAEVRRRREETDRNLWRARNTERDARVNMRNQHNHQVHATNSASHRQLASLCYVLDAIIQDVLNVDRTKCGQAKGLYTLQLPRVPQRTTNTSLYSRLTPDPLNHRTRGKGDVEQDIIDTCLYRESGGVRFSGNAYVYSVRIGPSETLKPQQILPSSGSNLQALSQTSSQQSRQQGSQTRALAQRLNLQGSSQASQGWHMIFTIPNATNGCNEVTVHYYEDGQLSAKDIPRVNQIVGRVDVDNDNNIQMTYSSLHKPNNTMAGYLTPTIHRSFDSKPWPSRQLTNNDQGQGFTYSDRV